jgi:hypothetical protein
MRIFTDINFSKEHGGYHERSFLQALFFGFHLNCNLILIFHAITIKGIGIAIKIAACRSRQTLVCFEK